MEIRYFSSHFCQNTRKELKDSGHFWPCLFMRCWLFPDRTRHKSTLLHCYHRLVKERNEIYCLVRSNRTVGDCLHMVRVEISGISQLRICIKNIFPVILGQQVSTFLGQNAEKLLEGLERLVKLKFNQRNILGSNEAQIILNIREQRGEVVRIVPTPTGKISEIVLVHKFKPIHIVRKDVP